MKPQPYTASDLLTGEQIVKELHGIQGFDAWAERIAKAIAAERARIRIAKGENICRECGQIKRKQSR